MYYKRNDHKRLSSERPADRKAVGRVLNTKQVMGRLGVNKATAVYRVMDAYGSQPYGPGTGKIIDEDLFNELLSAGVLD